MGKFSRKWSAAVEDTMAEEEMYIDSDESGDPDVVEIDVDEDGAALEPVGVDGEPTPEAEIVEVNEAAEEVEDAVEEVEELDRKSETLEEFSEIVESRIASGRGMTAGELEFMKIGIAGRIKVHNSLFPSSEAFSYNSLNATTEALESLKQGIRALWDRIVDAIKSLFAKVKNWWLKTLDAAPRLKKRAEAIAKKAGHTQGTISEKKITLSNNGSLTAESGKGYSTGTEATTRCEYTAALISEVLNKEGGVSNGINDLSEDKISTIINNVVAAEKAGTKRPKPANNDGATVGADMATQAHQNHVFQDNMRIFREWSEEASRRTADLGRAVNTNKPSNNSGIRKIGGSTEVVEDGIVILTRCEICLPGRRVIEVRDGIDKEPQNMADLAKSFRNTGIFLIQYKEKDGKLKSVESSADYPTLSTAEVQDICGSVITLMDAIIGYKKDWEKRDKDVKEVLKRVDREVKDLDNNDNLSKQGRAVVSTSLNGLRSIITRGLETLTAIITYSMNTSKAFLLYCTRSLAQHKK